MFDFLFRKKLPKHKETSSPSNSSSHITIERVSSDTSSTDDFKYSVALENGHYGYIVNTDVLTDVNLNAIEKQFVQSINEIIDSPNSLSDDIPRLPDLLPKLLQLLRSNDASWQSVVDVINQDSVLVAGVIKVANSPFYRLNVDVQDLEQIVVHLGQKGVREVVMSVAFKPIMQFKGNKALQVASKKMWDHALKSAIASRSIANHYGANGFDAYLSGLVHNIGMSIILKTLSTTSELTEIPNSLEFKKHVALLSKQLSIKIVKGWNMPQTVVDAIAEQIGLNNSKNSSSLGQILLQGSSVSMQHSLMADTRWKALLEPAINFEDLFTIPSCKKAYAELNNFEL